MGVIVYPKAQAAAVVEAVDPMSGYEGIGPCLLGTPIESADGRYAHIHPWSKAEMDYLAARVSGITRAQVLESMPVDFVSKTE